MRSISVVGMRRLKTMITMTGAILVLIEKTGSDEDSASEEKKTAVNRGGYRPYYL